MKLRPVGKRFRSRAESCFFNLKTEVSMSDTRLVYSTEHGRICPKCHQPGERCSCKKGKKGKGGAAAPPSVPDDGVVRIHRETKGRKGKGVSRITGIPAERQSEIARLLKQKCGCGGSAKNGVIDIQTDQRDLLAEEIAKLGFTVKKSGG